MARQLIKNKLELTTEDILQALSTAGWPVPDPSAPDSPKTSLLQDGARWAIAWETTVDDITVP